MRHSRSQAAVLKDPVCPCAEEPSVTVEQLAAAIRAATAMDIKAKEHVCDTIHATQPNLLASVLALRSFGISMPTIEIVLNILIVLHLAIVESGQVLATVTEDDQDRELSRYTASVKFAEGLDTASFMRSLEQTTAYRKERFLFAYVVSTLMRSGIATQKEEKAKFPILAAINLVNSIATAKTLAAAVKPPSGNVPRLTAVNGRPRVCSIRETGAQGRINRTARLNCPWMLQTAPPSATGPGSTKGRLR